jgi:hypothetical protein
MAEPAPERGAEQKLTLVVSSCDAYEDCWLPFFKLLSTYWQAPVPPIYLNTETRGFSFPGLEIQCPRVQLEAGQELDWSDRLMRTLDHVPTEIVLYMQEDYFVNGPVDVPMLNRFVALMQRDGISHVSLKRANRTGAPSQYEFLDRIDQRTEYRISAQAGLWRVSSLRSYLRRHETVWELEWYGSRRAWRRPDSFYFVNADYDAASGRLGDHASGRRGVVPYWPTGVVHGRWVPEVVVDLFAAHDIEVDYERRGFYDHDQDDWKPPPRLTRALRRLRSIP